MYIAIIIIFCLFTLLRWIQIKTTLENFVTSKLVQSFKIKIGVWYDKNNTSMYDYLSKINSFIPMDIVTYSNRYQLFYELKRREIDLIFTNEKDYYIYWLNQTIKKRSLKENLKRNPQIQMITMAYNLYVLIPADYTKIRKSFDINGARIGITAKEELGQDFEKDMIANYKTKNIYKSTNIRKQFEELGKTYDIMFLVGEHPNKLLLNDSNEKDLILLDTEDFNLSDEYYLKYMFLNKKKMNLIYYPKILNNNNSKNRIGSLLTDGSPEMNAFTIKTMIMGLDFINNSYIYEFMKIYYSNIFKLIQTNLPFNNFVKSDMAASRMAKSSEILSIHEGAAKFYKKIGLFTNLPEKSCSLIQNTCTEEVLAAYGDYIRYETL